MELLVHVSASASKKDDEVRVLQAQAYTDYVAASRQSLNPLPALLDSVQPRLDSHGTALLSQSTPIFVDDSQLATTILQSQLGLEVSNHDRASASALRPRDEHDLEPVYEAVECHSSVVTAVFIGDEQVDNASTAQDVAHDPILASPVIVDKPASKQRSGGTSQWTGENVLSQLPSSYTITDEAASNMPTDSQQSPSEGIVVRREHVETSDAAAITVSKPSSSILEPVSETVHLVPSAKSVVEEKPLVVVQAQDALEAAIAIADSPDAEPTKVQPESMPSPTAKTAPSQTDATLKALDTLHALPHILRPPAPQTSDSTFDSHESSALHALATNPNLQDIYAPLEITRIIDDSERGYWQFDTRDWPIASQISFWTSMNRVIEGAGMGWGIWCSSCLSQSMVAARNGPDLVGDNNDQVNDDHDNVNHDTGLKTRFGSEDKAGLGIVRVFCWGQVVKHVYLLLYVASTSKIRRTACAWHDADEQIVVQM